MSSGTANPPKSILKKTQGSTPASTAATREERNRATALYHANLIQQRKDVELQILKATEELLDFPTSPTADPAHPSTSDATRFKDLLRPFQTSDYDALIQERNIDTRCGYALCPRPRPRQEDGGKLKIVGTAHKEKFRLVPREKLEQWCSEDCARRGLYLRVQLSEEPAWVRNALGQGTIEFLEETYKAVGSVDRRDRLAQLSESIAQLGLGESTTPKDHALRDVGRGYADEASTKLQSLSIVEKHTMESNQVTAPSQTGEDTQDTAHSLIEGHRPSSETRSKATRR